MNDATLKFIDKFVAAWLEVNGAVKPSLIPSRLSQQVSRVARFERGLCREISDTGSVCEALRAASLACQVGNY